MSNKIQRHPSKDGAYYRVLRRVKKKRRCCICGGKATRMLFVNLEKGVDNRYFCNHHLEIDPIGIQQSIKDFNSDYMQQTFGDKDYQRVAGRIAAQLAVSSPFMDVLESDGHIKTSFKGVSNFLE